MHESLRMTPTMATGVSDSSTTWRGASEPIRSTLTTCASLAPALLVGTFPQDETLAPSLLQGPRVNPVPEDDIADGKAVMPEGDPLALVHAPGLVTATDFADLAAGEHTVANQVT